MKKNFFKLESFLPDVEKDIQKGEQKQIKKASSYFKRKLKAKIKAMGLVKTGNLLKGVTSNNYPNSVLVGIGAPGYHALLVEKGHKMPTGGEVEGKYYFRDTFREETTNIQKILNEPWL